MAGLFISGCWRPHQISISAHPGLAPASSSFRAAGESAGGLTDMPISAQPGLAPASRLLSFPAVLCMFLLGSLYRILLGIEFNAGLCY
jgi:hypothetical protein